MSCVDGSHIARVDLMDWLGSGAVLCPACFCGAYDRCGLTAFCTRGTETTASPLSHLDGTMAAQKFAVLAVGIHVSRTGTTFDQHRVSALGRKRTFVETQRLPSEFTLCVLEPELFQIGQFKLI